VSRGSRVDPGSPDRSERLRQRPRPGGAGPVRLVRRSRDAGARHGLARTAGGPAGPLRGREGSGAVSVQKRAIVQKRALPWGVSFAAALVLALAFASACSKKDAHAGATPEAAPVTVASVA